MDFPVDFSPRLCILSPECQRQREMNAIAHDPRLYEKIGNQAVVRIEPADGGYVIYTHLCFLKVDVTYLPPSNPKIIGEPKRFELMFNDPIYYEA